MRFSSITCPADAVRDSSSGIDEATVTVSSMPPTSSLKSSASRSPMRTSTSLRSAFLNPCELHGDRVDARGQERHRVVAVLVGDRGRRDVGLDVDDGDRDAGHRAAGLVGDPTGDGAAEILCREAGRHRQGQQHAGGDPRRGAADQSNDLPGSKLLAFEPPQVRPQGSGPRDQAGPRHQGVRSLKKRPGRRPGRVERRSEDEAQAEAHETRLGGAGDLAERGVAEISVRVVGVERVGDVERVDAELGVASQPMSKRLTSDASRLTSRGPSTPEPLRVRLPNVFSAGQREHRRVEPVAAAADVADDVRVAGLVRPLRVARRAQQRAAGLDVDRLSRSAP